ncbi:CoB--CoM heterodisulfide reductase iron-sulfur subunit A family protein [Methanococcus maripaludis]|jgi:heterodisulfide reductase subunit A|uniref:CoB--CoM heterodisulfide reductase iron-sulfur subunit A n=2 Tax=Methanococcus maripaludis TaxID=39152 RepID=A0A8T3VWY0_METMI|nr:CoB--CoM heterodisulfide reductase iron-sulfur subunit A family protein [Methanococcus maripaludis]MBG0768401.1 CoB--CoM heterodisulfide reductase iron-sulfur subunit A family protein [Methanococcus maripaludis]BAP62974.1 heterodisulfide reductase subunit A [Methanococcus maripaludis OS7]
MEEPKIGVYVCHCGVNIGGVVDCENVARTAEGLENVVIARDYKYMCADPGQELIKKDIKELGLNRVIVAACSPRLHEPTFRRCVEEAGLNPFLFEFANIREHCSWVHMKEKEKATEKANDLVRMAVAKARQLEPLDYLNVPVTKRAMVIGAGVAGIQAALDLGDAGYETIVVEKTPSVGGRMAQLDKVFPTNDCSICILAPKMVDVAKHPNIKLYSYSEVKDVKGYIGNFKVKIEKKPRYLSEEKCTGCGSCEEVCPISVPNEFDMGIGLRKAIYKPFPQAVPAKYTIDKESCIDCGLCAKVCGPQAIDYGQKPEIIEAEVGTIISAIGYDPYDPTEKEEYGYGKIPNVITSMELERMINASGPTMGKVIRPSDGQKPKRIAFIQCVGSRDAKIGKKYCSNVCCMYAMKNSQLIKEKAPETDIDIYYMDIRAFGKGYEEFYERSSKQYGIKFIRGRPAQVLDNPEGDSPIIRSEDTLLGEIFENEYDLVVLSVGMVPTSTADEVQKLLGVSRSADRFFMEAHPKLKPVDTATDGIYLAGACQGPKDIPSSVAQGSAAASRAAIPLAKGEVQVEPIVVTIDENVCGACGICVQQCPYGAPRFVEKDGKVVAEVLSALCKGCGTCAAGCPSGALEQSHFKTSQIYGQIEGAFKDSY